MPDSSSSPDVRQVVQAYLHADLVLREARLQRERYRQQLLQFLGPSAVLTLPDCTVTNCHGRLSVECH